MNIPIRNVYYLLCYAWGHAEETEWADRSALAKMDQVQDLIGKILAEGTFRLLRRGIDRGYREITEEIPGVRGKLHIARTASGPVRSRARTVCTYEVFSPDVLHNRILRSTLDLLLRTEGLDASVRRDVGLAHDRLEGIASLRLSPQLFRQVQLDRNQRIYRFLLSLCQIAYESLLVDERTGDHRFLDFRRDEARMWKLFEDFALEFFRREQEVFPHVHGQKLVPWHQGRGRTPADEEFIPNMYSDILLESPRRRLVLDTKFYRSPLSHRHGSRKLKSENLYQLLTYLENRSAADPTGPPYEGVLLYAAVDERFQVDVELQGFPIRACTVDLARPWTEVHQKMLDVLA